MKTGKKHNIDLLPVLGITGLLFVILYFLLANINGNTDERKDPYHLFYKLYKKLGYKLTDHYMKTFPRNEGDLLVYFDYDDKDLKITGVLKQWVDKGGALFIAGIKGDQDPLSSSKLQKERVKPVYTVKSYAERGQIHKPLLNLKGKYLKLLPVGNDAINRGLIMYADQGALLYKSTKGAGAVFVLSDSALLKNDCLREENVALLFNNLLRPYFFKRIYIVRENFSGNEASSILVLLFKDKLLFISLQLIWIMLLFIVWQGKRFGEPQLLDPYVRRTLSEHLKAIGYFYQKTKSLRIIDEINCGYFRYRLHKITGLRLTDASPPGDIEKLKEYFDIYDPGLSREQIMECLKKDADITLNRLQTKAKLQDSILKFAKHVKPKQI